MISFLPTSEGLSTQQLRDRVFAMQNGQSVRLSKADQNRRARVLARLRKGAA